MWKTRPLARPLLQFTPDARPSGSPAQGPLPLPFLLPWLSSAGCVLVGRFFHAADLGYDLTAQLQAAQNLLAGRGLTTYWPTTGDIADPLTLQTLTHFPSGFSLCAAALMALGAGPGLALKIVGAAAMMLGWWGWARLAFAYMEEGWRQNGLWKWIAIAIAVLTPLLFTLSWSGTDIILWAAIPWVLVLVVRSQALQSQGALRLDAIAGALTGFCVLVRYASLFLAGFVLLAIVCQCRWRRALLFRRAIAFSAALLPFLAVQTYIDTVLASAPAAPGGIALNSGILTALERGWDGLFHVSTISAPVFFWLSGRRIEWLMDPPYQLFGLALTAVLFSSPVILAVARHGRLTSEIWHDVRMVAAFLFVFLPVFLLLCETLGTYDYALDHRYYMPLVPLAVFVAYLVARSPFSLPGRLSAVIRLTARGYLAAFLIVAVTGVLLLVMPGARGRFRRTMLLGTTELHPWPSTRVSYEFSPARDYVLNALKAAPEALLLTSLPNWFWADPAVDRSKILRIEPCDSVWVMRVTGPVRLMILAADLGGPLQELYFDASLEQGRAECYERLPPFDLVQRFPDEGLKLLHVEIPAGVRIALKEVTAPIGEFNSVP